MKKIAIQGHFTKSKDIIKILESLGGINIQGYIGHATSMYYYVNDKNHIECDTITNLPREYKKYTLEEYKQKFNKMKNKRTIQIDLTTAKEWYNQGGDLRKIALQAFSENELQELPKSWKEYCNINPYLERNKDAILLANGTITPFLSYGAFRKENPGAISSEQKAKQFLTLNKLLQIRDYYNQNWEPNWNNRDEEKHVITAHKNDLYRLTSYLSNYIFAFKTKELRDEFFNNFKEDLEFIKEFL